MPSAVVVDTLAMLNGPLEVPPVQAVGNAGDTAPVTLAFKAAVASLGSSLPWAWAGAAKNASKMATAMLLSTACERACARLRNRSVRARNR